MKIISAYDFNDKLIEGTPYTNKKGDTFIINEYGESLNIKDVKTYRIVEDMDTDEVQAKVNDDLNQLDIENNDKIKNISDSDLDKAAKDREKELKAGGMNIKDGDYENRFISAVKATSAADGIKNGTVSDSEALKNYIENNRNLNNADNLFESEETDKNQDTTKTVDEIDSVNTCTPELDTNDYEYQDNKYKKIYSIIDEYTESAKSFNSNDLLLNICEKYKINVEKVKGNTLVESIKNIINII